MQGIGLRQRDAFPKGAFKAFPELGGGAAGHAEELELQPEGLPGKVGGGCRMGVVDCHGVLLSARRLFPPGGPPGVAPRGVTHSSLRAAVKATR